MDHREIRETHIERSLKSVCNLVSIIQEGIAISVSNS